METVVLSSARLTLRNLREEDSGAMSGWRTDIERCRYIGEPMSAEEIAAHIERCKGGWSRKEGETLNLAVELRDEVPIIGEAMMRYVSVKQRQVEIGLALNPPREGQELAHGRTYFGLEACLGMLRYCFEELGAHRVIGFIDAENTPSLGLTNALGMSREGLLRKNMHRHGEWRDEYLVSLLEDEWPSLKHRLQHLLVPPR